MHVQSIGPGPGREPLSPLLSSGFAWSAGLGATAALLYVALDPNLRPAFGGALLGLAPRWIAAFLAAACAAALACRALPDTRVGRGLAALAGACVTPLGLAIAVAAAPSTPWTLVPGHTGAVFLRFEGIFLALLALAGGIAAWPLARWARARVGRPIGWPLAISLPLLAATLLALRVGWPAVPDEAPADAGRQLILIGIDGADLRELAPLIERGVVPHLTRLVGEGASGPLATFRPTESPIIWTTIATGQPSHRHGILGFLEPETHVPYTSNARRVPALWNLLGERGVRVGVFGWWVTWPAEPVNGTLVSYHVKPDQVSRKGSVFADLPSQTHPPGLIEEIGPGIASARARGHAQAEALAAGYDRRGDDPNREQRVATAAWALGTDLIVAGAARRALSTGSPRFLATYFASVDSLSHMFCHTNPWRARICGRALDAAYQAVDEHIGALLEAAVPGSLVMIVSDHGFDRVLGHESLFPPGPDGIVLLHGEGVAAGARIEGASVFDVTPTVLALFDLPQPRDLRGRPLLSAFTPGFVERLDLRSGPSHDPGLDPDDPALRPIPSASDPAFKQRLRALGYLE